MFKVGDKGKTRDGRDYEITLDDGEYFKVTVGGSSEWWYEHNGLCPGVSNPEYWELTSSESSASDENVEIPEYLPEEVEATAEYEYDLPERSIFEELADIAMRYGIPVEYDVASDVVTFNRFS